MSNEKVLIAIEGEATNYINAVQTSNKSTQALATTTDKSLLPAMTRLDGSSMRTSSSFRTLGSNLTSFTRQMGPAAGMVGEFVGEIVSMGPAIGAGLIFMKSLEQQAGKIVAQFKAMASGAEEARKAELALAFGGTFLEKYLSTTRKELDDKTTSLFTMVDKAYPSLHNQILQVASAEGSMSSKVMGLTGLLAKQGITLESLANSFKDNPMFFGIFGKGNQDIVTTIEELINRYSQLESAQARIPQTFEKVDVGIKTFGETAEKTSKKTQSAWDKLSASDKAWAIQYLKDLDEVDNAILHLQGSLAATDDSFPIDPLIEQMDILLDKAEEMQKEYQNMIESMDNNWKRFNYSMVQDINSSFKEAGNVMFSSFFAPMKLELKETQNGFQKFGITLVNSLIDTAAKIASQVLIQGLIVGGIVSLLNAIWPGVGTFLIMALTGATSAEASIVSGGGFGSIFKSFIAGAPSRASGGPVSEGMWNLHDNEYVLNANQTRNLGRMLDNMTNFMNRTASIPNINIPKDEIVIEGDSRDVIKGMVKIYRRAPKQTQREYGRTVVEAQGLA